jgi:hypothetical protein
MSNPVSLNPADYPTGYLEERQGHKLFTVGIVLIILEVIFAVLRYHSRRKKHTPIGIDDWFIWPALVFNVAMCVETIVLVYVAGVGTHVAELTIHAPHKLTSWSKGIYACEILYVIAVALPKLSILGFYLRFLRQPIERALTWFVAVIVAATALATGLTATFQCSPVAYQWDKHIPSGHCIDIQTFYRWMSFPNIVTDVVILVLPLPMVWRLQLERNQKVGITIMFVTGGVGLVSSILRFVAFFSHSAFTDRSWTSVPLLIYTDVEPGTYFIAACMPSLGPVFRAVWKSTKSTLFSKSNSQRSKSNSGVPLSTFSLKRKSKDPGFERITSVCGVQESVKDESAGNGHVPRGAIGVTSDIRVVQHDV